MKRCLCILGLVVSVGCNKEANDDSPKGESKGSDSPAAEKTAGAKAGTAAPKDPRTMTAEEFMNQPLPPGGPSQNAADYPADKNDRCNFAPMRPEGFPALGREMQISEPKRVTRQFVSMLPKKNAGLEEWQAPLEKAGFKTKIYSPQTRYAGEDSKELLAIRGSDVLKVVNQPTPDMPVSMAMVDYMKMRHDMEFLLEEGEGLEFLGIELEGDDGIDVAYAVESKDAVDDLKGLQETAKKIEKDDKKAIKEVAKYGANIYQSWEAQKKKYKAFLEKHGISGKQTGDQVYRISDDFLIRFFPPQGISRDWVPRNKGQRVFTVDFENEGC